MLLPLRNSCDLQFLEQKARYYARMAFEKTADDAWIGAQLFFSGFMRCAESLGKIKTYVKRLEPEALEEIFPRVKKLLNSPFAKSRKVKNRAELRSIADIFLGLQLACELILEINKVADDVTADTIGDELKACTPALLETVRLHLAQLNKTKDVTSVYDAEDAPATLKRVLVVSGFVC